MSKTPEFVETIADALGGTVLEVGIHPDGESGFATLSYPLPSDHWLYKTDQDGFSPRPHYPMLAGRESMARDFLAKMITEHGGEYGVKCATNNGREEDFDPDALVRNVELGLFGMWTDDGLTGNPDDAKLFDPIQPGNLGKVLLEAVGLAVLDGLITAEDVAEVIMPTSLEAYREAQLKRVAQRERDYQELRIRKGWDKLDSCYAEDSSEGTEKDIRSLIRTDVGDLDIADTYPKMTGPYPMPSWSDLQVVHDDDASVLSALSNEFIIADLELKMQEAFDKATDTPLTSEQLIERCKGVLRNAFSGIVPDVEVTTKFDNDKSMNGYDYQCIIKLPDTSENRQLLGIPDGAPVERTFTAKFHPASDKDEIA